MLKDFKLTSIWKNELYLYRITRHEMSEGRRDKLDEK